MTYQCPSWLAAETESIRVGSGGVMLPNHLPLIVAEQFGSIGAFGGGRIDLGIGKGPAATAASSSRPGGLTVRTCW
jgi:alkanesulfonate monooxygenase SsuD/methylene tetrahydromethanopterin reductase-like flavin-dependent oxidoreductase (luciferase family)